MKKTLFLGLICLIAAAALVFAGGQGEGKAAAAEGTDDPLEFYGWDFQPDQIKQYCNEFEQNYDEKVNVHIIPNIGYVPALQTKIMGGARMDVFYNFRWNQLRFYNVGWAHGLSDFEGADEIVDDIVDSAKPAYHTKDGELISLPYFAAPFVNMYNPVLLEEAGYDNFPATKEEMYEMCKALKANGVKSPYVAYWNKDFIDRYFFIYLISEGIEVFDGDFNPVFQNDAGTKKVMEWWAKMYQEELTTATILTDGPSEGAISMQEGRSAFFNLHHYFLKGIRESGTTQGENVILGPQIPGKTGTTLQIGEIIQMSGGTPDPERAWKLLKFYSWKDQNGNYHVPKTWAFAAGLLVPYKGFFEDPEIIESFEQWINWDLLNDIFKDKSKIETVRMQVWYPDWRTESADVLHQMLLGDISADEAIQEVADIAERLKREST
jgi:multiple sugar transport system substrate-binding protein